ncbi:MAG: prepilin-type N-terminal cleavage/methylation domain-containing protein [Planctomycetota bacterium]|nr:prepilin-type N-terminal cleavage/methylation domain-containing protein [Planctomycetota bacterium]MDA1105315.1 prepilin-type N-terminal cleavage/methylation domain-containing protein [Planctomycetota bacterium]
MNPRTQSSLIHDRPTRLHQDGEGTGRRAFTLVEILVVIGIIVVLIGLLVPVVGAVSATSRQVSSQSNLKHWGTGTMMYLGSHKDKLPWEGMKDLDQMDTNLGENAYWANAIPPLLGERPYSEIADAAFNDGFQVPVPGQDSARSIFVDPSAVAPDNAPWSWGPIGPSGNPRSCYFNYVPNSQLNNTYKSDYDIPDFSPKQTMAMSMIPDAEHTILMMEMRSIPEELKGDDPYFGEDLARHRGDWKRFAARHFNGGHLLFGDGHVGFFENRRVITSVQGSVDPDQAAGDWNIPGELIWDPLGAAIND